MHELWEAGEGGCRWYRSVDVAMARIFRQGDLRREDRGLGGGGGGRAVTALHHTVYEEHRAHRNALDGKDGGGRLALVRVPEGEETGSASPPYG